MPTTDEASVDASRRCSPAEPSDFIPGARIASVTVAYNNADSLRPQVRALLQQSRPLDDIIVVDNGSSDGTAAMMALEFPTVTVLRMPENLGYGAAWTAGLSYATLECDCAWVWTFDGDSIPHLNALAELLHAIPLTKEAGAEIGIVAANAIDAESGQPYEPLLWDSGIHKPDSKVTRQPIWFADLTIAAGALVSRKVVQQIGFPRADLFLDFTDFEYCLRARSHGFNIAVVSAAKITHAIGDSRRINFLGQSRIWSNHAPFREYYIARNMTFASCWLYPSIRATLSVLRILAGHAAGIILFGDRRVLCLLRMVQGVVDGVQAKLGIRFRP